MLPRTLVLLALLGAGRAGAQPAASAPSATPRSSVEELLLQAIAQYQKSEFDEARRLLTQVLRAVGRQRTRTAEEAHTYAAFVHVAFGETDAAVEAFERALAINPDLALSAPAPRIAAALAQARRRHAAKVRALDHDPPRQVHLPLSELPHGRPATIIDEVSDISGVKRVVLNYRVAGDRGFSTVTMERDRAGRYVATIPASAVVRPGVEYFLEAWDGLGNGPGLKGSSGAPIRIVVQGGPLGPGPSDAGPPRWFQRWWVWAIAAGTLAAAGGIASAVYFSRSETARFDIRVSKDFNP